jgi:membrane-bound lytic murein transglycosylase D
MSWQVIGCASSRVVSDHRGWPGDSYGAQPAAPSSPVPANLADSGTEPALSDQFSVSNPRVNDFVTTYQTRWRGFYQNALNRGGRYLSRMERLLRKENVPAELAYLPLIESGFRPHAVSSAGAVGPWQFIRATGRRYGLRIDGYVDERRDPVKSTVAAARYLRDLYAQFGDWHLSLAAYNRGEMHIARLLERGRGDDYWDLSDRGMLPAETRDFVPQFLAAVQIAQAPEQYGFEAPSDETPEYDLVRIDRSISLKTVAKLSNASPAALSDLNPALHRGVTPPSGYTVRVPKGTKEVVLAGLAQMHREAAQLLPSPHVVASTHRLRNGESLAKVAKQHGVTVTALLKANGIRNPRRVAAGRLLRIPGSPASSRVAKTKTPARVAARRKR